MAKYRSYLSLKQIAEGIDLCVENARDLLEDAVVLKNASRYPRALTCVLVAREELAKIRVFLAMAKVHPKEQWHWRDLWNAFRDHELKAAHAAMDDVPDKLRDSFHNIFDAFDLAIQVAPMYVVLREASLYADFSQPEGWTSPSKIDRHTVEHYYQAIVNFLHRYDYYKQLGLFSLKALAIMHEELAEAYRYYPRGKEFTKEQQDFLLSRVPDEKRCLARLIVELGISLPNGATIIGQPWREFVERHSA